MPWQFVVYITGLTLVSLFTLWLAYYSWQRQATGARLLAWLFGAVAFWSFTYILEIGSFDLAWNLFWGKWTYLGVVSVPVAWFTFGLAFSNREALLTRRNLLLLCLVPALTLFLVWTNEWHRLFWRDFYMDTEGAFPMLAVSFGPWFWVHSVYSYILLIGGTVFLLYMLMRSSNLYRTQGYLLSLAVVIPFIANGAYLAGLLPELQVDPTPFVLTLSASAMAWAFYRYHFLDIVPVARRMVIDVMDEGVIVLDANNKIIDINPAAKHMLGQPELNMTGLMATQFMASWYPFIDIAQNSLPVETDIKTTLVTDINDQILALQVTPLYTKQAEFKGHLLVLRDITDQKQTEWDLAQTRDQALAASRLKSELLARVSHELRTPLNIINGYAELCREEALGPLNEAQKSALDDIIDNANHLATLINELINQRPYETATFKLNSNPFNVRAMMAQVESQMNILARKKGLVMNTQISYHLPDIIMGDQARLQQILVNLIGNAIKFTQSGAVTVQLDSPDPAHWSIRVTDTGPGIPQEAQTYIFEPFRQVDGIDTWHQGGSHTGNGLGLSIVRQLTKFMHGQLSLESKLGEGSTFMIILPLIIPETIDVDPVVVYPELVPE